MNYFLCILLSFPFFKDNNILPAKSLNETETTIVLNKKNVAKILNKENVVNKNEVFKQILLESAHLTSKRAIKNNNITGMRCVKKRQTNQCGCDSNNFGIYKTWQDCIKDYKYFQEYHNLKENVSSENYYQKLKNWKYCKDSTYINILKQIRGIKNYEKD